MDPAPGSAYAPQPMDLNRARFLSTKWAYVLQGAAWALLGTALVLASIYAMSESEAFGDEQGKWSFLMLVVAVAGALMVGVGAIAVLVGMRYGQGSAGSLVALGGLLVALFMLTYGVGMVFLSAALDVDDAMGAGIIGLLAAGAGIGAYVVMRMNQPNAWVRAGALIALAGLLWLIARTMDEADFFGGERAGIIQGLSFMAIGAAMALHGATQGRQRAGSVALVVIAVLLLAINGLITFFDDLDGLFETDGLETLMKVAVVVGGIGTVVLGVAAFVLLVAAGTNGMMASQALMAASPRAPGQAAAPAWAAPQHAAPAWQQPPPAYAQGYGAAPGAGYAAPAAPAYAQPATPPPAATLLCPRCHNANAAAAALCATCGLQLRA